MALQRFRGRIAMAGVGLLGALAASSAAPGTMGAMHMPGAAKAAAPATPACGRVPPRLVGTYETTITRDDLPPELFDFAVGKHVMRLGPRNRYSSTVGGNSIFTRGPLCVSGDRLSIPPEVGTGTCAGRGRGLYRWHLQTRALTLVRIEDRCIYRAFAKTVHAFKKVSNRGVWP